MCGALRVGVFGPAALAGIAAFAGVRVRAARAATPNILVIVADDRRAHTLNVMPRTRRIFFENGRSFPRGFVTTPLCCPSRASIFTGLYAHNHGVPSRCPRDSAEQSCPAEASSFRWCADGAGWNAGTGAGAYSGAGVTNFEADRSDKQPWVRSASASLVNVTDSRARKLRTHMSVDALVGRVFHEMESLGERHETLAIYLSDNGDLWGEHGVVGKRVPLHGGRRRSRYDDDLALTARPSRDSAESRSLRSLSPRRRGLRARRVECGARPPRPGFP